ncbi:alpha-amylase family glycosyl hydrolase [Dyella silvatica]|uniref:alpha-amylase family glycosyl hydrolase n=1 Tax=Dyella silvatica TaxID=2992128 RepID=UPI00224EAF1D|nr:alpha-amylase family glycosyl hydrolase [Dyella silvatica]
MLRFRWFHWQALLLALALAPGSHAANAPAVPLPATTVSSSESSGVYYEIFVRSWFDSNGDGVGDLNGVTAKLDYLQQLGVSGIWLMPINPSPSYHGYDVTDYQNIQPEYGNLQDFQRLLAEAHKRGIEVIIDLVVNHTSDRHPWFQAALNRKDPHHDWYTWAGPKTDLRAMSAAGGPAWHDVGTAPAPAQHYLGDFAAAMPDLNYDQPAVRQAVIRIGRFWLQQGVDGFRLDAARHIYDDLQTDTGKPVTVRKNIVWWTEFRQALSTVKPDSYLVGEVTQPSIEQLQPYLKPLGSVFDFPLAEQLIKCADRERDSGIGALLERIDHAYRSAAGNRPGPSYVGDAPFLSNHDQERVISQLHGNAQHMRMAAAMLLTLPGRPFIYYGEELGVPGHKPDLQLRQPLRWQRAANAPGQTHWQGPLAAEDHGISVEAEQADPDSLWSYYSRLIHWRMQVSALRDGSVRNYAVDQAGIVAYERITASSRVLVIHNLSGTSQTLPAKANTLLLSSKPRIAFEQQRLSMPPYSTAVLQ